MKGEHDKINNPEIRWYISRSIPDSTQTDLVDIHFPQIPNLSFRFGCSNPSQTKEIVAYFNRPEQEIKSKISVPTLLYKNYLDLEFMESQGIKKENLKSRFFGVIEYPTERAVVLGGPEFGLCKSVTIGFASTLIEPRGYHPAHASFCSINKRPIMMTGGHFAGKTTSLFYLLENAKKDNVERKVLTDDWLVINESSSQAIPLEEKLSFSKKFCSDCLDTNLKEIYERLNVPGRKKVYLTPEQVYGAGSKMNSSNVNFVIFLEPVDRESLINYPNLDYVVEGILKGTYHMPDCDKKRVEIHRSFWHDFLRDKEVISLDTRHSLGPMETYRQLYKFLKSIS
jgi:hypothetical protein